MAADPVSSETAPLLPDDTPVANVTAPDAVAEAVPDDMSRKPLTPALAASAVRITRLPEEEEVPAPDEIVRVPPLDVPVVTEPEDKMRFPPADVSVLPTRKDAEPADPDVAVPDAMIIEPADI